MAPRESKDIETMAANSKKMEVLMSPRARLLYEPTSVCIVILLCFKTRFNTDQATLENIQHSLSVHPRFSSRVVKKKGKMKWVPTEVDINNHVFIPDVNPAAIDSPDKFIDDYASDLSTKPMDMSKPLWDYHILNLKTSDAESSCIFRVHHSIGDGISLISLLLTVARKLSDPEALPSIPTFNKKKKKSDGTNSGWFCRFFYSIWYAIVLLWNTMVDLIELGITALFFKDTKTPLMGPKGCESNPRRFVRRIVSLDDVKLVKNAMNSTVNDVIWGVVQAGLSTYLNRKYSEGKKEGEKMNNLPKNIHMRALVVVNVRPIPGLQTIAEMVKRGSKMKWGNKVGTVLLPVNIYLRENPLDYVRNAKATMDRKKHSLEALGSKMSIQLIYNIIGIKIAAFASTRVASHTTLVFSNVFGPMEEVTIFGCPLAYLAPACYGAPSALVVHVQSYADKLLFSLSVDENTIPDHHQLLDDFEESLKLIKNAVIETKLEKSDEKV